MTFFSLNILYVVLCYFQLNVGFQFFTNHHSLFVYIQKASQLSWDLMCQTANISNCSYCNRTNLMQFCNIKVKATVSVLLQISAEQQSYTSRNCHICNKVLSNAGCLLHVIWFIEKMVLLFLFLPSHMWPSLVKNTADKMCSSTYCSYLLFSKWPKQMGVLAVGVILYHFCVTVSLENMALIFCNQFFMKSFTNQFLDITIKPLKALETFSGCVSDVKERKQPDQGSRLVQGKFIKQTHCSLSWYQ